MLSSLPQPVLRLEPGTSDPGWQYQARWWLACMRLMQPCTTTELTLGSTGPLLSVSYSTSQHACMHACSVLGPYLQDWPRMPMPMSLPTSAITASDQSRQPKELQEAPC